MEQEPIQQDHRASYRDGTVMGLTAAEAFMLISFILLLLLTWRFVADGNRQEELERVREFGDQFSQEEKRLALIYRERLLEFDESIDVIDLAIDRDASAAQLQKGLELERRFGNLDPDLMDGRLRLMDKERLRMLLESVQDLPEDELQRLTNMTSTEGLARRLQELEALKNSGFTLESALHNADEVERLKGVIDELSSEILSFEEIGLTPEEIRQLKLASARAEDSLDELTHELKVFEEIGLTPEEVRQLQADAERVKNLRQGRERSRADVASQLREKIGARIAPLGGRILDNGDVIFPDRGLFEAGSAKISPEFDGVLEGVCRRWFEVLYGERRHLDTVQIEGHASSEFRDFDGREAFDANLDLSQRRASAVFKRCLDFGGRDDVADWAQSRLVAIGFSSARPIKRDGVEDRRASRRVEFAIGMKSED